MIRRIRVQGSVPLDGVYRLDSQRGSLVPQARMPKTLHRLRLESLRGGARFPPSNVALRRGKEGL